MEESKKHFIQYSVYILVWMSLLILTCLTVSVATLDLAKASIIAALSIATIKSYLVLNYFMHLKYEGKTFKIMFLITFITMTTIIGFIFFDISLR